MQGCLGLTVTVFLFLIVLSTIGGPEDPKAPAKAPEQITTPEPDPIDDEQAEADRCRQDLQCWGRKYLTRAEINCAPAIAELALYAYEWTDGFRYRKFDKWAWLDREAGTIGYNGRMIKMLDARGYWHPRSYWCQYNPATGEASAEVYN